MPNNTHQNFVRSLNLQLNLSRVRARLSDKLPSGKHGELRPRKPEVSDDGPGVQDIFLGGFVNVVNH